MSSLQKRLSVKRQLLPLLQRKKSGRIRNSRSYIQPTQMAQLLLTTKTIRFYYQGTHSQSVFNKQLVLTNNTGTRIAFKIKSNNPQSYQVTPSQGTLPANKKCQIKFRLYIQSANPQKYNLDKFMLEWGYIDQTQLPIYVQRTYLNVEVIAGYSTIKNQSLSKAIHESNKEIKIYRELISHNIDKIKELEGEIQVIEERPKPMTIGKNLRVLLGLVGFVLGYLIF